MASEERIQRGRLLGAKYGPANGHKQGVKNVASGHLDRIRHLVHEVQKQNGHLARIQSLGGKKQGAANGRKAAAHPSEKLLACWTTEHAVHAAHIRWHELRGLRNPKCYFCIRTSTDLVAA